MLLKLQDGSELEIGNNLCFEKTLEISADDRPGTHGPGCIIFINKREAETVVAHICAVFGITP